MNEKNICSAANERFGGIAQRSRAIRVSRFIGALLALFVLTGAVLANDWASTGKGGSSGKLPAEKIEKAWKGLLEYKTGDDQGALLAMEWVVIDSLNDAKARVAVAAKLASILDKKEVSYDAKCFICAMLFRCGTPAEVPAAAKLLDDPKTADIARLFLERVPSEEAAKALRNALDQYKGKRESIGIMNSLSIKKDEASLPKIFELTQSTEKEIALASWRAISNFSCDQAADFLIGQLKKCQKVNIPLEAAAIRVAAYTANDAKRAELYQQLGTGSRAQGARQAVALYKYNKADNAAKAQMTTNWMKADDPALFKLAAGQIMNLDDAAIEKLSKQSDVSQKLRIILIEELAKRQGEKMIPAMLENAKSKDPATVQMALRFLGNCSSDARVMPVLIDALSKDSESAKIASESIIRLSKDEAGPALLNALKNGSVNRDRIVTILSTLKYYEAIDPLVKLARSENPAVYEAAVEGLRGICDPDQTDLNRMLNLYLEVKNDKQRDFIARAIAYIAEKNDNKADRAKVLLACIDAKKKQNDAAFQTLVLPLIGRIGSEEVYRRIDAGLKSSNPYVAAAAVRALCNWPTADHAEALWAIAESENKVFANQALRAYIRVVTLPNKRAEAKTLAMLQKAFKASENDSNRNLALSRASVVRTLDTVRWAESLLDNPALSETACKVIVELAHHRFLRQPNKAFFDPILRKVEKTAKDKSIAELAEKARMGM